VPYYQVDRLLRHGYPDEALKLLNAYGARVAPDEAAFLFLRLYHAKDWRALYDTEIGTVLQLPLSPRVTAQFCAHLIRNPDPGFLAEFGDKFVGEGPSLSAETLPLYHATYLAAALAGDQERAGKILAQINRFTGADSRVLRGLAELLATGQADARLTRMLPLVPLPIEVVYAALERSWAPAKK
jgi:hypothetical protein